MGEHHSDKDMKGEEHHQSEEKESEKQDNLQGPESEKEWKEVPDDNDAVSAHTKNKKWHKNPTLFKKYYLDSSNKHERSCWIKYK